MIGCSYHPSSDPSLKVIRNRNFLLNILTEASRLIITQFNMMKHTVYGFLQSNNDNNTSNDIDTIQGSLEVTKLGV